MDGCVMEIEKPEYSQTLQAENCIRAGSCQHPNGRRKQSLTEIGGEITFIPATQKLAEQYFGGIPPYGFRGHVAVMDGQPVGIGGLFVWEGIPIVFTQLKDEMRPHRKAIARAVRVMVEFMDSLKMPVYATADKMEATSEKLLAKLGFVPTGIDTEHGELLIRKPQWHS